MQISLSTACLYIYPLRKIFEIAQRVGFDGVELVISPEVEWRGGEYIRRLSDEYALPILSVHPPLFGFPGWNKIHTSIAPFVGKAVRITQEVRAPLLVLHMPRARTLDGRIGSGFINAVVAARNQLNGTGPRLTLENSSMTQTRDQGYILRALPALRAFAEAHDFSMTLDTAHLGTWELDLLDSLKYFEGRLANVHFSDLRRVSNAVMTRPSLHSYVRQHQLPGEGYLPLKEFLRRLAAQNYRGPITYELSPVSLEIWSPRRAEEKLRASVEFARMAIQ
jgi:sugar phosphate isomerase/epimerase